MDGNEAVAYDDTYNDTGDTKDDDIEDGDTEDDDIEDDDIKDDDDDDTEDDDGDLLPSERRLNQKSAEPGLFHICVGKHCH